MKMKVSTRVILTVYLVVIIGLCAFLLVSMLGLLSPAHIEGTVSTMMDGSLGYKAIYAAILIVMIAVSFMLMFFGIRKEKAKSVDVAASENGKVAICISALEELALKYVNGTAEIKNASVHIEPEGEAEIEIKAEVGVIPDVCIPEVVNALRTGLITYIEAYSGIKVVNAVVTVASVGEAVKTA